MIYCSLNYTSAAFLKHHTVDIVLCYRAPHISSIGSIDNRDSTFVTKMSDFLVNQSVQNDCKKTYTLHPGDPHCSYW